MSKYARVVSGCYSIICLLIESLPEKDILSKIDEYNILLDSAKFWNMVNYDVASIRKSVHGVVKTLCVKFPSLVEARLSVVSKEYLAKVFGEKDGAVYPDLWDAVLVLTRGMVISFLFLCSERTQLTNHFNNQHSHHHGFSHPKRNPSSTNFTTSTKHPQPLQPFRTRVYYPSSRIYPKNSSTRPTTSTKTYSPHSGKASKSLTNPGS